MRLPPGRLCVLLIAGALALAAGCNRERGQQARISNVLPRRFVSVVGIVEGHLWVRSDVGIVAIDPVSETWTMVDMEGQRVVPSGVIVCGSDVWLRLAEENSIGHFDLKTRKLRITAMPGMRWPGGQPEGLRQRLLAAALLMCGQGDLWVYDQSSENLFKVPAPGATYERFAVPRWHGRRQYFEYGEFVSPAVFLLAPSYQGSPDTTRGLFRFEPSTSKLDRIDLPGPTNPVALTRVDQGLLVRMPDSRAFVLNADGRVTAGSASQDYRDTLLARGDSVVWIGASYDVSPSSYFVVRYIRDAREPKDLVVLPLWGPSPFVYSAVSFLGMLWGVSDNKVVRIDPNAEELVTYQAKDSTGGLVRRSFRLKSGPGAGLLYFNGDTLGPFQESPTPADTGQKPEG